MGDVFEAGYSKLDVFQGSFVAVLAEFANPCFDTIVPLLFTSTPQISCNCTYEIDRVVA